ncbi:hypothetical protein L7F22_025629 [Adiantum nelumboides]|nr:hypothetical protein [Adiantum nelumboides]
MRGGRLHHNVSAHPFLGGVRTAPHYRMYSVRDQFPALLEDPSGGVPLAGEIYDVPLSAIRTDFLPDEPPELELTVIELDDGRDVLAVGLRPAARGRRGGRLRRRRVLVAVRGLRARRPRGRRLRHRRRRRRRHPHRAQLHRGRHARGRARNPVRPGPRERVRRQRRRRRRYRRAARHARLQRPPRQPARRPGPARPGRDRGPQPRTGRRRGRPHRRGRAARTGQRRRRLPPEDRRRRRRRARPGRVAAPAAAARRLPPRCERRRPRGRDRPPRRPDRPRPDRRRPRPRRTRHRGPADRRPARPGRRRRLRRPGQPRVQARHRRPVRLADQGRSFRMSAIAFVGLGIMGGPMARHLVKAGHDVVGHNRSPEKAEALAADGGRAATTVAEAVTGADVVALMLPDSPDVVDVCTRDGGVFDTAEPGTLVVDFSTIRPDVARDLAARAAERGLRMLDAPVSGGQAGAENAALSIMVGGEEADVAAARPLLDVVGSTVVHVGPSGAGQTVKAANQLIVAGNIALLAEAIEFLRAHGADLDAAVRVLGGGLAGSKVLDQKAPKMLAGDYAPASASTCTTRTWASSPTPPARPASSPRWPRSSPSSSPPPAPPATAGSTTPPCTAPSAA